MGKLCSCVIGILGIIDHDPDVVDIERNALLPGRGDHDNRKPEYVANCELIERRKLRLRAPVGRLQRLEALKTRAETFERLADEATIAGGMQARNSFQLCGISKSTRLNFKQISS